MAEKAREDWKVRSGLKCLKRRPLYRWTSGVQITTGQLGQEVATSVGMAIACNAFFVAVESSKAEVL